MAKQSAGLLLYRKRHGQLEFLLVHPGGPFWKNKDLGAWTIPKGEIAPGEEPLAAARREVREELGFEPEGPWVELIPIQQKAGKQVSAWAVETNWDPSALKSNTFKLEWPPRSGNFQDFPEVDQAAFFSLERARTRINPAQIPLLEDLARILGA
ncbi:MAG TPA: NUDIX domain-containing protein [Verrucomicrobiae bacterium]|nr:NUDIX domain-containing protein [Verrucomicrobiae bacterium]